MSTTEKIKQELINANNKLKKVEEQLERLNDLRRGAEKRYPEERSDLEKRLEKLEEGKKFWREEVGKWEVKLREINAQTGKWQLSDPSIGLFAVI